MPLSELQLIKRIRRAARAADKRGRTVATGIGDDCAVLRWDAKQDLLVTTDLSLEGVHFRRDWHPAESAGHRCLARGLSDIAAMGGDPVAAFLSLATPADCPQRWVDGFLAGLLKLAARFRVELAGGDVAESPAGIVADIVVVGRVPRVRGKSQALLRSGARPGDSIYVTGELGRSAAVLHELRDRVARTPSSAALSRRKENRPHFFPEPRIEIGRKLRGIASAAIDISDGLSTDLMHICEESGVGALIHEHSIPRGVHGFVSSSLHFALHGGEDYELLFTAPQSAHVPASVPSQAGKVRITRIGEIIADKKRRLFLVDSHGQRKQLAPAGWQHFGQCSG